MAGREEAKLTEITGQPAYQQVANDLRSKIADGTYPVGGPIPATNQLMSLYNGSMTVVRAAIRDLQTEGILIGQPGKGVYVQRMPTADEINRNPDVQGRIIQLEDTIRQLSARVPSDLTSEIDDLRRQLGILQGQMMDLYGRVGVPYPHQMLSEQSVDERTKSA